MCRPKVPLLYRYYHNFIDHTVVDVATSYPHIMFSHRHLSQEDHMYYLVYYLVFLPNM